MFQGIFISFDTLINICFTGEYFSVKSNRMPRLPTLTAWRFMHKFWNVWSIYQRVCHVMFIKQLGWGWVPLNLMPCCRIWVAGAVLCLLYCNFVMKREPSQKQSSWSNRHSCSHFWSWGVGHDLKSMTKATSEVKGLSQQNGLGLPGIGDKLSHLWSVQSRATVPLCSNEPIEVIQTSHKDVNRMFPQGWAPDVSSCVCMYSLRDGVELGVEPLLNHVEWRELSWLAASLMRCSWHFSPVGPLEDSGHARGTWSLGWPGDT